MSTAGNTALHGFGGQVALLIQAVALAHGFFEVFDALDLLVLIAANFQTKAVGAQINGGERRGVWHGAKTVAAKKGELSSVADAGVTSQAAKRTLGVHLRAGSARGARYACCVTEP